MSESSLLVDELLTIEITEYEAIESHPEISSQESEPCGGWGRQGEGEKLGGREGGKGEKEGERQGD